jgi:hypothetical protein
LEKRGSNVEGISELKSSKLRRKGAAIKNGYLNQNPEGLGKKGQQKAPQAKEAEGFPN